VNEERFRNVGPDSRHVQDIVGIIDSPADSVLIPCDFVHGDYDEITAGLAILEQLSCELSGVKSRSSEAFATEPYLDYPLTIFNLVQLAESGYQHLVDRQIAAIYGKASGGKQSVIKQIGSRPMAAHHEDGAPASFYDLIGFQIDL
jgi:hypothetical protein